VDIEFNNGRCGKVAERAIVGGENVKPPSTSDPSGSRFLRDPVESLQSEEFDVSPSVVHATPFISLLAGFLILVAPALLNYIVAIYLIAAGLVGLNEIHHFVS
jgi:hypothetical protein